MVVVMASRLSSFNSRCLPTDCPLAEISCCSSKRGFWLLTIARIWSSLSGAVLATSCPLAGGCFFRDSHPKNLSTSTPYPAANLRKQRVHLMIGGTDIYNIIVNERRAGDGCLGAKLPAKPSGAVLEAIQVAIH